MTKICRVCKKEKVLELFHPNKSCKLGVTGTCRECTRVRIGTWYKDRRVDRQAAANKRNRDKKRIAVEHYGGKCADCGGVFPLCVYEFHHLDPDKKDVNPSYALNNDLEKAWAELGKCVMLCSNCHKIRHFGEYY